MAIYGVIYAVICKDIREILAYHIISQVGFMVCGIGIGTDLALNGATAHAYSHILYKSLLFMSTGAVLYATGTSKMVEDRKSTRLNSSHVAISYAVFCLKIK